MKPVVIIPARFGSTRFPGKPLVEIDGLPMVVAVYSRALLTGLTCYVATDDERIAEVAKVHGAKVVMTGNCANGTERCAEAAKLLRHRGPVVNWQGDSPLTDPAWIPLLLRELESGAQVSTPVQLLSPSSLDVMKMDFMNGMPGGTLAALDDDFRALYFSKAPIPTRGPWWLHIGVYAYSAAALAAYGTTEGRLERSESLEQLRFLETGVPIHCVPVHGDAIWEVNNPADVAIVERMMESRNANCR